jgi:hypothetical protein
MASSFCFSSLALPFLISESEKPVDRLAGAPGACPLGWDNDDEEQEGAMM